MPEPIRYDTDPVRRSSPLSQLASQHSYALSYSAEAVKLHILTLSFTGQTCPTFCYLFSVVKYIKLFVYKEPTESSLKHSDSVDIKTFIYSEHKKSLKYRVFHKS